MTDTGEVVLEARGISKSFPGVKALDDVGLTLRGGRLTALLGESGAGKSTLMNVIAGVFPPDAGELLLAGKPVRFTNPRQAQDHGIAMIFQELNLVPGLTVAENIYLGREPLRRSGLIDGTSMNRSAAQWLKRLELDVSPTTPVGRLRIGQQQVVVKNLESNYRRVSDVSGATIMGDGRVALILDVGSLARRTRH